MEESRGKWGGRIMSPLKVRLVHLFIQKSMTVICVLVVTVYEKDTGPYAKTDKEGVSPVKKVEILQKVKN